MEQELSNSPSADRTFLSSTFPNTHSLSATLEPDFLKEAFRRFLWIMVVWKVQIWIALLNVTMRLLKQSVEIKFKWNIGWVTKTFSRYDTLKIRLNVSKTSFKFLSTIQSLFTWIFYVSCQIYIYTMQNFERQNEIINISHQSIDSKYRTP